MPPAGEALDDDYVINLLKKDAEANQKRYISNGLGSLLSKRPLGHAPKPNTRFLKNIIRETDSHNAALKAKEEEESRARLRELRGGKRRRLSIDEAQGSSKRRRGEERRDRWTSVLGGVRHCEKDCKGEGRNKERRSEQRSSGSGGRPRTRSPRSRDHTDRRHRVVDRSTRPARRRSRSPGHSRDRRQGSRPRSRSPRRSTTRPKKRHDAMSHHDESDSDPLDDILGPKPASESLPRGRGALKSSDMDHRFDPSYNPKEDVNLDPEEDREDWDMALEALRDRAKWRAQGADRLRAAGFTDAEVDKWERGDEKNINDVKWVKKGEGREWDRGKVLDSDGQVDLKPEWGRLKGT